MRRRNESGMVTAFAVVFAGALVLFAGLVFDGGMILSAKQEAIDNAQSAARAGAQAVDIDAYRSTGAVTLDSEQAKAAAQRHLRAAGADGTVIVSGNQVRVSVSKEQPMKILGLGGLAQAHVTGVGEAEARRG